MLGVERTDHRQTPVQRLHVIGSAREEGRRGGRCPRCGIGAAVHRRTIHLRPPTVSAGGTLRDSGLRSAGSRGTISSEAFKRDEVTAAR